MESVSTCFFSANATALTVSAFIFFITLFLVSKQWIGFSITLLLLMFSLLAGVIIVNEDIFRNAIAGTPSEYVSDNDIKTANFHEQILKEYDGLKAEMEIQKHKLQTLSEEVEELKTKPSSV